MQQSEPYVLHDNEVIPYPRLRRGIIIISFIFMVIWIVVIIFYAYKDPNIICGTNPNINILTYMMLGTSFIGLVTYLISTDSRLKIKSWIRRIPMFWNSVIDSGYTPYFDPDYFEIKNGHYVRVQSNVYNSDDIGLPKVDAITPLNSFNMAIYRNYHQPALTKAKSWMVVPNDLAESLLRKFIIERTRIVLVGHSCLIVKAWSGEHLLIHKSKYNTFINDQRSTTLWPSLDNKRTKAMTMQESYIEGLRYMTDKLVDPTTIIPLTVPSSAPIRTHYNQLINEMAAINSSISGSDVPLQDVFKHMIHDSQVPQSWKAVDYKHLELKMAALAKNINHQLVQNNVLDKLDLDDPSNQTEYVLDTIRNQFINSNEYKSKTITDARLVSSREVIENLAMGPVADLHKAFEAILTVTSQDRYPIRLNVIHQYATKELKPHISAYQGGYRHLHGLSSVIQKIPTTPLLKTLASLKQTLTRSKFIADIPIHHVSAQTQKIIKIELAKAEVAIKEFQKNNEIYRDVTNALKKVIANTHISPDIKQYQDKHEMMRSDAERQAISIAKQKENLERELDINEKLLSEFNNLKPQLTNLQEIVLKQSNQLEQLESKMDQSKQQLDLSEEQLAKAKDQRNEALDKLMVLDAREIENKLTIARMELEAITADENRQSEIAAKQLELATIQQELNSKQAIIDHYKDELDQSNYRIQTLQESINQRERILESDKLTIERTEAELAQKTTELKNITEDCRLKAIQLAEMAQGLKSFEEANAEMAKNHMLMLKAFQEQGDAKLMQMANEKDQETLLIKQELAQAKQALNSAEAQKQDLEIALVATKESAEKLNAQKTIATNITMTWKAKMNQRMKEISDAQYRELLQKFNEINDEKTQLEVQLEPLKLNLDRAQNEIETLKQQASSAVEDQTTSNEEKEAIIKNLTQQRITMEHSVEDMKATVLAYEETINKSKSDLAEFNQKYNLKLQEVDKQLAKEHANAAIMEAQLKEKTEREQSQAIEIQRLREQLDEISQKAASDTQRLREELIKSNTIHEEDIKQIQELYDANLNEHIELCKNIISYLEDYRSVIQLPLIFKPRRVDPINPAHNLNGRQVIINLDLPMIKAMNETLNELIQEPNHLEYDKRSPLFNVIKTLYPNKCAPGTFLDKINGRMIEFLYTMYEIINTHKGITMAISGFNECTTLPKDQYEIINQCNIYRDTAHKLFDNNPKQVLEIIERKLELKQLIDVIVKSRYDLLSNEDSVFSKVFMQLDSYTYSNLTALVPDDGVKKVKKTKKRDSERSSERGVSELSQTEIMDLDNDYQDRQGPSIPPKIPPRDSMKQMFVAPSLPNEPLMPIKPRGNPVMVKRA